LLIATFSNSSITFIVYMCITTHCVTWSG